MHLCVVCVNLLGGSDFSAVTERKKATSFLSILYELILQMYAFPGTNCCSSNRPSQVDGFPTRILTLGVRNKLSSVTPDAPHVQQPTVRSQ
jgi:hypothetical protein